MNIWIKYSLMSLVLNLILFQILYFGNSILITIILVIYSFVIFCGIIMIGSFLLNEEIFLKEFANDYKRFTSKPTNIVLLDLLMAIVFIIFQYYIIGILLGIMVICTHSIIKRAKTYASN